MEKLLDKATVRVVTKAEDLAEVKTSRMAEIVRFCKLRNIQLDQSRTIITVFMRMLTQKDTDISAIATRLLEHFPRTLERESSSYGRMIIYLEYLAEGGPRRTDDDLVAAGVYTKRSATFAEIKTKVSAACEINDWSGRKKYCEELRQKHAEIAALWHVRPESLKVQNMKAYKDLSNSYLGDEVDHQIKNKVRELTRQVLNDAERRRVPWQVGKEGEFGDKIEPLNEAFLREILTRERPESRERIDLIETSENVTTTLVKHQAEDDILRYKASLLPSFVSTMQKDLSAEDVCEIIKVPIIAMRVFTKVLNPGFIWEDLGQIFKPIILELLKHRSNRAQSRPLRKLLGLEIENRQLQSEG